MSGLSLVLIWYTEVINAKLGNIIIPLGCIFGTLERQTDRDKETQTDRDRGRETETKRD